LQVIGSDLISRLFPFLPISDINRCLMLSRKIKKLIVGNQYVWFILIRRDFSNPIDLREKPLFDQYKLRHNLIFDNIDPKIQHCGKKRIETGIRAGRSGGIAIASKSIVDEFSVKVVHPGAYFAIGFAVLPVISSCMYTEINLPKWCLRTAETYDDNIPGTNFISLYMSGKIPHFISFSNQLAINPSDPLDKIDKGCIITVQLESSRSIMKFYKNGIFIGSHPQFVSNNNQTTTPLVPIVIMQGLTDYIPAEAILLA